MSTINKIKNHLDYSDNEEMSLGNFSPRQIWTSGFNHAADIPRFNLDMLKNGMDEDDARDKAFNAWSDAEDNARQYSPFEFTAKALNECENPDRAWELFDEGIQSAFEHGWNVCVMREFTFI